MITFLLNTVRLFYAIKHSWSIPEFRSALALTLVILLSGTLFYHNVEGWSWIDAFYFSVTTASTVGLGDLAPKTDAGKLFTALYIFVGVGVLVALFAQLAKAFMRIEDKDH